MKKINGVRYKDAYFARNSNINQCTDIINQLFIKDYILLKVGTLSSSIIYQVCPSKTN